jgi:septal ring factor EnvC (AmiA/AmiB activator)
LSQLKETERRIQDEYAKMEAERERHRRVVEEQNRIDQQKIADQERKKAELEAKLRKQANRIAADRAIQEAKAEQLRSMYIIYLTQYYRY